MRPHSVAICTTVNADFTLKTTKALVVVVVKKSPLTFQVLTAEEELHR
jgi:hypothetical protein